MPNITLYSYEESGNSYKVRLLLAFLGLDHARVEIDLMKDEQHQPAYLAINPRGEVPALIDGDVRLCDSAAIMIYVAGQYGRDSGWWSQAPAEQAAIVEWLAFAASWVQYGVFTARAITAFGISANGLPHDFREDPAAARLRGVRSLEILDAHLACHDWLACGRPTLADIAVFPYVALAPMGRVPLSPHPHVLQWIARFRALPKFTPIPGLDDPDYRAP